MSMDRKDRDSIIDGIRRQYISKENTELDELIRLDREARRPAVVFAYVFGSIAALVMGTGMSLVMTEIGSVLGIGRPDAIGIVLGIIGLAGAIACYPIYKAFLLSRCRKYSDRILAMSNEMRNE